MKLEVLGINLRSFKTYEKADLDLSVLGPGLHYVRGRNLAEPRLGSNGASKSTLFAALVWCLYGKTQEGLRTTDVVPWGGKKNVRVIVDVACDGEEHAITRSANPNKLLLDDKVVGQETIDALIGLSYDVFCKTVVLGQGQPLFLDLSPNDKIGLFTDLLQLNRWDELSALASEEAKKLERRETQTRADLSASNSALSYTDELLASTAKRTQAFEDERATKVQEMKTALSEARKRLEGLEKHVAKAEVEYDMAATAIKVMRPEEEKAQSALAKLRTEAATLEARVGEYKREIARLSKDASAIDEGNCPTCGQALTSKDAKRHQREHAARIKELQEVLARFTDSKLGSKVKEAEKRLANVQASLSKDREKLTKAKAYLESVDTTAAELRAMTKLKTETIERAETEPNPFREQEKELRAKRKKQQSIVDALTNEHARLAGEIEDCRFWVRGFKDIRLLILEDVLSQLGIVTNAYLDAIGLVGWEVNYAIEKETKAGKTSHGLDVAILSPANDQAVRWQSWSGGEGQRLRLVNALALSEVLLNYANVEIDFEVLDEPTRHMSREGVNDLCDFLADRSRSLKRQTWYVDHQIVESNRFASVLTVTKREDGSACLE